MMDVIRYQKTVVNTVNEYQIGDKIKVGKYTATCQKITSNGAIFMLDQYLDKTYPMDIDITYEGGYEESDLRQDIRKDFTHDPEFDDIRDKVIPFENGDLVRIPTVGELFGQDDVCMTDDAEQWELMKKQINRIATRKDKVFEWGWLQNVNAESGEHYSSVNYIGSVYYCPLPLKPLGVRPVFMLDV